MSAQSPLHLKVVDGRKSPNESQLRQTLDGLQSRELVIGFSGPLGAGVPDVIRVLKEQLSELDYVVVEIKLSSLMPTYESLLKPANQASSPIAALKGKERYEKLQTLGNDLRKEMGMDFLAQLAVREISIDRTGRHPNANVKDIVPDRVAYLIDQLKHPKEIDLFRTVYQDNFFLVGVLCGYTQRKANLKSNDIDGPSAEALMERDRKENLKFGQQLEKTLQLSDFFVRSNRGSTRLLKDPISRFLHLMHGDIKITPTRHEQGMYAAYSAAMGSACLSRQVGAAILDKSDKLIATGCNDVPRGGGGLYREDGTGVDFRCIHIKGGMCFNHKKKDELSSQIQSIVEYSARYHIEQLLQDLISKITPEPRIDTRLHAEKFSKALAKDISEEVRGESKLKDLIEFSRSVHAEMDALISLARSGTGGAQDSVLYTTTYPCHNCARHIVAAGIRSVYFVEPYEKSLAYELHDDAIEHDADEDYRLSDWDDSNREKKRLVRFMHFEGVAPRRFLDLFSANGDRKDEQTGNAVSWTARRAVKKVPEYLEGYIDLETRVVQHLSSLTIDKSK